MPPCQYRLKVRSALQGVGQPPAQFPRPVDRLDRLRQSDSRAKLVADPSRPLLKHHIVGGLPRKRHRLLLRNSRIQKHREHGAEIPLQSLAPPRHHPENPIHHLGGNPPQPPPEPRASRVAQRHRPDQGEKNHLNTHKLHLASENEARERGKRPVRQHVLEHRAEHRDHLDLAKDGQKYHDRSEGERDDQQVIQRPAHLRKRVILQLPRRRDHLPHIPQPLADRQHGHHLLRQ